MPYIDKEQGLVCGRRSFARLQEDPERRVARNTKAAAYMRERYRASHPIRAQVKEWGRAWLAIPANRAWFNFLNSLRRYGLTLDQYHAKLESQDFLCGLCHEALPTVIDHDHATGKARGILCRNCNTGFGNFRENVVLLERAVEYAVRYT